MHSCPYCVDDVDTLKKFETFMARVVKSPLAIGHNAQTREKQRAEASQSLATVRACLASRGA